VKNQLISPHASFWRRTGRIAADLFRYFENCLVERATFPIFLVEPKPVSGHETLASTKELLSPAKRPVACLDAIDMNPGTIAAVVHTTEFLRTKA
jgi:hypothetical protein